MPPCTLHSLEMSTPELGEKGGEGPPDEGIVEKEEGKGGMRRNIMVRDIGEIDKEVEERNNGEVEGNKMEGMQEEERFQKTGVMRGKNDSQDNSKDISQVNMNNIC